MSDSAPDRTELERVRAEFQRAYPDLSFRWRHERETHGDVEVDALLLEAFGVPGAGKLDFVRRARQLRRASEERLGRDIILVTHTPEATREHYPCMLGGGRETDAFAIVMSPCPLPEGLPWETPFFPGAAWEGCGPVTDYSVTITPGGSVPTREVQHARKESARAA